MTIHREGEYITVTINGQSETMHIGDWSKIISRPSKIERFTLRAERRIISQQMNRLSLPVREQPNSKWTYQIDYPVAAHNRLRITVVDEPGAGGANHEYRIAATDDGSGKPYQIADHSISFQNGPINEHGVNGITQEVLLAIVADRLKSFQAGPFACRENALALTKVEEAQHWLQQRTLARMRRGVEGTNKI